MSRLPLGASVLLWMLLTAALPAAAQDDCRSLGRPPEGDTASAQRTALEAFSRGSRATETERWDNAEQCFRLAWELSHVALARYNQAVALRALGHHLAARDAFDEAIAAGLDETRGPLATSMRAEAAANVSGILIDGVPPDLETEIELDGLPVELDGNTPIECDGGRRTIVVRAPGYTPFTWSGDVVAGTVAAVHVDLARIPSGGNVLEEPLFWIITGVVLAGAGIGVGVFLQDQAQLRGEAMAGYVVDL